MSLIDDSSKLHSLVADLKRAHPEASLMLTTTGLQTALRLKEASGQVCVGWGVGEGCTVGGQQPGVCVWGG